ncbi:hypothetical protein SAMN05519104_7354 [Rhizobiales bacterium GAS188]|jgi:hypothetical protein|nr:hypothetical protein SAMN05519104_7354 [Rhizobiales bacterium GAS188]
MNRHGSISHRAVLGLALATLAAFAAGTGPTAAADLGAYGASPCAIYAQSFNGALRSIRQTARVFRAHERSFHRLKRVRANDGFTGPDIALNAVMSAEQVDVATGATEVAISVQQARRLGCFSPARLNEIENEASRIKLEIAEETIWIDPVTFR